MRLCIFICKRWMVRRWNRNGIEGMKPMAKWDYMIRQSLSWSLKIYHEAICLMINRYKYSNIMTYFCRYTKIVFPTRKIVFHQISDLCYDI